MYTIPRVIPLTTPAQRPRQVGVCLKHLPSSDAASPSSRWTSATVPWQRVVNAKGVISPRGHPAAVRTQAELLRDEGVEVHRGGLGELSVDLEEYGWFPSILPSEAEGRPVQDEEEEGMFVKQEEAMVKKEEESD